ncbi:hypothetical protein LBMAG28_10850 [Methylophilaceae bacterium]|nr:hypothetical protein LBMAG28_10850 [Methylophilaceae bacterium]
MSELKNIFKTIERGLPNKTRGIGLDVTDLVDSTLLNKMAGDELTVGLGADSSTEKLKPLANIAFKKGQIQGGVGGAAKDDFGAGILYNTDNNSGSASFNFSKTPEAGKNFMFRATQRFKHGGLLKQGKPKIAFKGWK